MIPAETDRLRDFKNRNNTIVVLCIQQNAGYSQDYCFAQI